MLKKYEDEGLRNLEDIRILKINDFRKYGSPLEIVSKFGGKEEYLQAIRDLEDELYIDIGA